MKTWYVSYKARGTADGSSAENALGYSQLLELLRQHRLAVGDTIIVV